MVILALGKLKQKDCEFEVSLVRKEGRKGKRKKTSLDKAKARLVSLFKYIYDGVFEDFGLYVVLMNGSGHTSLGEEQNYLFSCVLAIHEAVFC